MKIGRHSYFLGTDHTPHTPEFEVNIGNFTRIAEGVFLHSPDNHASVYDQKLVSTYDFGKWGVDFTPSGMTPGRTFIGNDVWIGEDVKILSGAVIHDGAIIGAHSVIAKEIPPYAVVVGNPGVIKRFRFPPEIIHSLLSIKWWNWSDDLIRERLQDFKDIATFIQKYG